MNVPYFFRGLHKKSGDRMREVLGGLPGLIYLPFTWDEEEAERYLKLSHRQRMHELDAGGGHMGPDDLAMPLGLARRQRALQGLQRLPFTMESHVMICILP
jgi:hypothetical protein